MKILYSRLLIAAFSLMLLIQMQELKCSVGGNNGDGGGCGGKKQVVYNDHDFQIYKLLSSTSEDSSFWLPVDVIRHIAINTYITSGFLSGLKFDCTLSMSSSFSQTCLILQHFKCACPNISVALLKVYKNDIKISFLEAGISFLPIFEFDCFSSVEQKIKTLRCVVDKKEFVDFFKQPCISKSEENMLHVCISMVCEAEIMKSYCDIFLDYAKNCPKKSKEVLSLFKAKDDNGKTILNIAQNKNQVEVAAIIKNTIKELEQNRQRKENCLIQ